MLNNNTIAVIVPAYNEGKLINKTLETMPAFVDSIIVINDCSADDTPQRILACAANDNRIIVLNHETNRGLGQTLIDGYLKSLELHFDVTAVMAGDAQMDPNDLVHVVTPITTNEADYVKGYRLLYEGVRNSMPAYRFFGNSILSILTKFATGYWNIIDPQCGYTAISKEALSCIPIEKMTKGYGYNADILNMLNLTDFRVMDIPVKPVYGEEKSKIKLAKYIFKVSALLLGLFNKRIWRKYIVREFNPLALFYYISFGSFFIICLPMLIRFFILFFALGALAKTTALIFAMSFFMATQCLFFAMWMDMMDNKELSIYGRQKGRRKQ